MNSTIDDRIREAKAGLDEPRFDEEATLLAAQPVVPLVEVKAKTRSKARLALALAIVGGLLIGLLVATLAYRFVGANEPIPAETIVVTEQPGDNTPQSYAGGETIPRDESVESDDEPGVVPVEDGTESNKPKLDKKPAERPEATPKPPPIIVREPDELDDDEAEEIDRGIRKAQRQEERRQRRRAAREARRQDRDQAETNDDLLRIREIFEGAPRP